jgi:hypothetical protein
VVLSDYLVADPSMVRDLYSRGSAGRTKGGRPGEPDHSPGPHRSRLDAIEMRRL